MNIYIKHMVSLRCKMIVKDELENIGIKYDLLELGMVKTLEIIPFIQRKQLRENLAKWGLEVLDDKKKILIEKIVTVIVEMIHYCEVAPKTNYSNYISEKMGYDYTYLANVFSLMKHITIQHFIIEHKIERVKEFLSYGELNLTEISYKLNYSSVAHLSHQFKKTTGLTPSVFKHLQQMKRTSLENV